MQKLEDEPDIEFRNMNRAYDGLRETEFRDDYFESWKRGETGYPMVDAGMRQLNETGFMHNRVRMVCASFLCKHLLIDWLRKNPQLIDSR